MAHTVIIVGEGAFGLQEAGDVRVVRGRDLLTIQSILDNFTEVLLRFGVDGRSRLGRNEFRFRVIRGLSLFQQNISVKFPRASELV